MRVKTLLLNLYETLRIRNVLRAIDILEKRWTRDIEDETGANSGLEV